jgi:hypothetical protein
MIKSFSGAEFILFPPFIKHRNSKWSNVSQSTKDALLSVAVLTPLAQRPG